MRGGELIFLLCALVIYVNCSQVHLRAGSGATAVAVDLKNGNYSIIVDGLTWFTGTQYALHTAGKWYRNTDSSLKLVGSVNKTGTDPNFGPYMELSLQWIAGTNIPFQTSFIAYKNVEMVLFKQQFPNGLPSSSVSGSTSTVVASFPTLHQAALPLYYYTYWDTFATPVVGNWPDPKFPGGSQGGPVSFYNSDLRSLVLSPFDNFMVGVQTVSADVEGDLACGLNGMVLQVPEMYTYTTVLYGGQGIGNTLYSWGAALLSQYKKTRTTLDGDLLISTLGYWTDNGAYYYYKTEPGKNYAQTMADVKNYVTSINVPVKNYQFDSWWYFKGKNNGVAVWEPMPSIFPDGMSPVTAQLGTPVGLHNRYFAPDSPYIANYSFIVESYCALPADQALFDHIMGKAKGWGMTLYEQDWLVTTYMNMVSTRNNVSNSRNWLLNMGNAATKLGLTIQYCMPLPNHLLQTVEIQSVTQSRASNDYNPANSQWQIFHTSQLIWSLGLVPFKDDFWTTSSQPNCVFSTCVEPNTVLETLVATLSAGPVGPSDSVNNINKELIMRTCSQTGTLLKADVPATPLESTFLPKSGTKKPALLQVAASYTSMVGSKWYYLLGADLPIHYNVSEDDLPPTNVMKYFDYFQFLNGTQTVNTFDSAHPIQIPPSTTKNVVGFNYYVIAPVLASGWVLLGETSKFITVSRQRVQLTSYATMLTITISGAASEIVTLSLLNTQANPQKVLQFAITIPSTLSAQLQCAAGSTGTCKTVN